jgi:hypothetical protein
MMTIPKLIIAARMDVRQWKQRNKMTGFYNTSIYTKKEDVLGMERTALKNRVSQN